MRVPSQYIDPLDQIWISTAAKLQLTVRRDSSAYASYDGQGTITIARPEDLDPDDCLAQMILHELCHYFVEGETSFFKQDWGLSAYGEETTSVLREHACQRLQAALLTPFGLTRLLAPTTEFRSYYDSLPENPIKDSFNDPAIPFAQAGLARTKKAPYQRILQDALSRTRTIYRLCAEGGPGSHSVSVPASISDATSSPTSNSDPALPSIWERVPPPALHPSGFPLSTAVSSKTCGDCAWYQNGSQKPKCAYAESFYNLSPEVELRAAPRATPKATNLFNKNHPPCVLFEQRLNCLACGACCKEGYDLVPLGKKDHALLQESPWTMRLGKAWFIKRNPKFHHCLALRSVGAEHLCQIYERRPQACSELAEGSTACIIARQRIGLCL